MWIVAGLAAAVALSKPVVEDFDLDWTAAESCPDELAVTAELHQLVGRAAASETRDRLEIRGTAKAAPAGFEVELILRDPATDAEEHRRFEDASCATATSMAVMLAAVAIRTQREQTAAARKQAPATRPREEKQPETTEQPERRAPSSRSALVGIEGSLGLVVDPTSIGAFSGGPKFGIAVRRRRAAVRVDGTYLVPRSIAWRDRAGAHLSLGTAAVQGCWIHERARWGIDACGGLEAGAIRARGFGVPGARVDHATWVAGIATAAPRLRVSPRVHLSLDGQLLVPLARTRVRFATPDRPIHRVGAIGGRIGASVHVRFAVSKKSEPS